MDLLDNEQDLDHALDTMNNYYDSNGHRLNENSLLDIDSKMYLKAAKAVKFQRSSRRKDKVTAMELFQDLLDDNKTREQFRLIAIKYLCDLYLYEKEQDPTILAGIQRLLGQQLLISQQNKSKSKENELLSIKASILIVQVEL